MKIGIPRVHRLRLRDVFEIVAITVIGTLVLSGLVSGILQPSSPPAETRACAPQASSGRAIPVDYLYLNLYTNPDKGYDFFNPGNFTVPSHTLVTVTVDDYDTGASHAPSQYLSVCGTLNDTMTVNGVTVHSIPANDIAHTFTITNGSYAGFNVPIPPASSADGQPTVVTFSFIFDQPGVYRWQCEANCSETAMSLDGRMSGLITVS